MLTITIQLTTSRWRFCVPIATWEQQTRKQHNYKSFRTPSSFVIARTTATIIFTAPKGLRHASFLQHLVVFVDQAKKQTWRQNHWKLRYQLKNFPHKIYQMTNPFVDIKFEVVTPGSRQKKEEISLLHLATAHDKSICCY